MLPMSKKGCRALPFPTCGLGKRQLAKYEALPDRTPEYCRYDQPPLCCLPCTPTSPPPGPPPRPPLKALTFD